MVVGDCGVITRDIGIVTKDIGAMVDMVKSSASAWWLDNWAAKIGLTNGLLKRGRRWATGWADLGC